MNRLKELRTSLGITIRDLADKTGINESTISKIEGGNRNLKEEYIKTFSEFFNVTAGYLLGIEDYGIKVKNNRTGLFDFLTKKQYSTIYVSGLIDECDSERFYNEKYFCAKNFKSGVAVDKKNNGDTSITIQYDSNVDEKYIDKVSESIALLKYFAPDTIDSLLLILHLLIDENKKKQLISYSNFLADEK